MFSFLDRIRHVDGHNVSFLVQPFGHHAEMLASIPPIKQMHAAVMPTPTDAVGSPERLLHIALAAGDFRMFHEEQRPIHSVVRTRNPTGVGTMNLITKPFFPQEPSGREQLVGRFDGLAPGRLLLAPHSHAITIAAREKRYGASTLSCPRKQLHHYCLSRRRHIVHIM